MRAGTGNHRRRLPLIRPRKEGDSRRPQAGSARTSGVAETTIEQVERLCQESGIQLVPFSGGVFQNVLLLRACRQRLRLAGFEVLTHHTVPPNDGGLALGQAAISMLTGLDEG